MGNPNLPYRMVAVAPNRTATRDVPNAPTPSQIAAFAQVVNAQFVVRYYPTRRGWMVTDVRQRRSRFLRGRSVWDGGSVTRHDRVFPGEDAAVMWAMLHTGATIDQ